jgi:hypothetical protein
MRPYQHSTWARSLCLFLAMTGTGCSTESTLISPTGPGGKSIALSITSVSPPVNITNTAGNQELAMVSGNYVLWLDRVTEAYGSLGDILACDISSGLDACASGRVQAINLTEGSGVAGNPSLAGDILVWIGSDGAMVGCSLTTGLDQCKQSLTVLRAAGPIAHPGTPFFTFPGAPVVNHHVVAWIESDPAVGSLYVYGCDIAGGLQNCASTTARLSLDNQAPRSKPAVGASHVFWEYQDSVNGLDIAGCDFSQGLSLCIQTATNVTNTSSVSETGPVADGTVLVWGETPTQGGAGFNVSGCSVLSGAVACGSPPVRLGDGFPVALDDRVLVWAPATDVLNACDIGSGLDDCGSTTVVLGFGWWDGVAVSGDLVAWRWCKNCDAGGSGGDFEIFGVRLTLSGSPPPPTLTQIVLTPATAVLPSGGTQQFTAEGRLSDGSITSVSVTYSATGGTITTGGLYTAGQIAGNYQVTATQQGGTLAGSANVTVTAPPPPTLTQIVLTPATVVLPPGGTQQFTAEGRLSDGSITSVSVTYSATGGTITSGGLYTAGQIAGNYQVIATQQGGTVAGSADITVTAPPPAVAFSVTPLKADFGNVRTKPSTVSFVVQNLGSGPIVGSTNFTGPFSAANGGAFSVSVGKSQSIPISFAPPQAGLYKGSGVFTVGLATQSVTLIGERFDKCGVIFNNELVNLFKKWWKGFDSCDLLNRLRNVNQFGIARYDRTTGLIATDTELFEYIERHGVHIQAVALQVAYGKTINDFLYSNGCLGEAQSTYLGLVEVASEAESIYGKVKLVLEFLRDEFSGSVGGLAVDIGLMEISLAGQLIEVLECTGQQDPAITGVRTPMLNYFSQRHFDDDDIVKHQAFIDATDGINTSDLSKSLGIPGADPEVFFLFAYDSYHLYKDVALRKAIGRGIACSAVEEWDHLNPPECQVPPRN